jgi:hypothetical protein
MTFSHKNLFKPSPIKAKVFGKAIATAVATAAGYNTVNGGNVKISIACIALSFLAIFVAEFFGSDELQKADAAEAAEQAVSDAADHAQDSKPADFIEHVVTEQTLADNPDLKDVGIKTGDTILLPKASDIPAESVSEPAAQPAVGQLVQQPFVPAQPAAVPAAAPEVSATVNTAPIAQPGQSA